LSDKYGEEKQKVIEDYPIFMAIAEDIGYDATGKSTNNNELDFIGRELVRFIESIESGKDSFFLGLDVDKDKIFLVNLKELEGRLDPIMSLYQRKITKFKYTTQNLSSLLKQKPQYGANEASKPRFSLQEPRYVRITDIDEYGLLKNNIGVTAESIENQYILNDNDILFARSGATVGKTYIHKLDNTNYSCFFAGYMIRFVVDETKISPDYVFAYTQLKTYSKWVSSIQRAAGQPNINSEEYKSLKIPIPPKEIQDKIISQMDDAYAAKKQKELEAQQLLDSIDDYLLGELGIELPEPEENTIQNRIFIRNLSEVSGDRFDPSFYKPEHIFLFSTIKKLSHDKLGHIVKFSYEAWDQKSIFVEKFPYIEIGEINVSLGEIQNISMIEIEDAPSRARMIVRGGDILISTTRPNRGAIVKIDQGDNLFIASTGFAIIRQIINKNLNKDFLFYALRQSISLKQMEQRSSGGNYPAITQEELKNILIPLPPLEKQIEISEHITAIRNQAKQLQQQAKDDLEKAKQEVEAMILGDD
jgi:restriction endonuclease S subunit